MKRSAPRSHAASGGLQRHLWWVTLVLAVLILIWTNSKRIDRINYLTELPSWSVALPAVDPQSETGYEEGRRRLYVPGHHSPSYEWIAQTQRALGQGEWRLRQVDHDNAPFGRETRASSPYRLYLGALAGLDHLVSGRPLSQSVEYAARFANPLLHLLIVLSVAAFALRRFGGLAAGLAGISGIALFPLGGNFQAGAPDHLALSWLLALWSALPILGAMRSASLDGQANPRRATGSLALAGACAGLGLWVDVSTQAPILLGLVLGVVGSIFLLRRGGAAAEWVRLPWRVWGAAGAAVCLLGFLFEYAPDRIGWAIEGVHPLHVLALLGAGELLARLADWGAVGRAAWTAKAATAVALSVAALLALPIVGWLTESGSWLATNVFANQLANHRSGVFANSFAAWLERDGLNQSLVATVLPVELLAVAVGLVASKKVSLDTRALLAFACAPAAVALVLAFFQLRWWNTFDLLLLPVVMALFGDRFKREESSFGMRFAAGAYLFLLFPGFWLAARESGAADRDLDELEVQTMLERDLAYWLAERAATERPIVFTTPSLSEALHFYGGTRGVVSHSSENESGFAAATRIASASSWAESSALLTGREVSYIVLPSWDPALENLVRLARQTPSVEATPMDTLLSALRNWSLAPWMAPLSYAIPAAPGFEDFSTIIVSMEAEQDPVVVMCRLAEHFIEQGLTTAAAAMREELGLHPRNLAALTMRGHISFMMRDGKAFGESVEALLPYLGRRSARALPPDRRLSLAVLLVHAKRMEEAREQMKIVAEDLDEASIRIMTTGALVRALALSKRFGLEFAEPDVRARMLELIPPSIREKVKG